MPIFLVSYRRRNYVPFGSNVDDQGSWVFPTNLSGNMSAPSVALVSLHLLRAV